MFTTDATIRDYNPTTDTATVELVGAGVIDTWIDGLKVDASLNRAFLAHGTRVTVSMPDAHRICEATVVAIGAAPTLPAKNDTGNLRRVQTGRTFVTTSGGGSGSTTLTFPIAFSSATNLQVSAAADDGFAVTIGTPTATNVTITVSGAPAFTNVFFSWHAEGNA